MRFAAAAARSISARCRPYGSEGHWLTETEGGVKAASSELDRALKPVATAAAKKR